MQSKTLAAGAGIIVMLIAAVVAFSGGPERDSDGPIVERPRRSAAESHRIRKPPAANSMFQDSPRIAVSHAAPVPVAKEHRPERPALSEAQKEVAAGDNPVTRTTGSGIIQPGKIASGAGRNRGGRSISGVDQSQHQAQVKNAQAKALQAGGRAVSLQSSGAITLTGSNAVVDLGDGSGDPSLGGGGPAPAAPGSPTGEGHGGEGSGPGGEGGEGGPGTDGGTGSGGDGRGGDGSTDGPDVVTGGGGGASGGSAVAFWQEVPINSACSGLTGMVAADLYVRFTTDSTLNTVDLSMNISVGEAFQSAAGGNSPPSAATLLADPCAAFDTFVTLDTFPTGAAGSPSFAGPFVATGAALDGTFFQQGGIKGAQLFGGAEFYVRIARLVAPANTTFSGSAFIGFASPSGIAGTSTITLTTPATIFDGTGAPPGDGGGGGGEPDPVDTDADGVPDSSDNCPNNANADQRDDDNDGVGNVCDVPPAPKGACCFKASGECDDDYTQAECNAFGGVYQGNNSLCTAPGFTCSFPSGGGDPGGGGGGGDPGTPVTGACCLTNGNCLGLAEADCVTADGEYQGDATNCASITCTSDPGGGGGDPGGGGGGGDPGGGGGGGDPDPEPEPGVTAIWAIAEGSPACAGDAEEPDVLGHIVYDLYLRSDKAHRLNLVDTVVQDGIGFSAPSAAYQHSFGNNKAPNPNAFALVPCLEFDSYFALGGSENISFIGEPTPADWGSGIGNTLWFTTDVILLSQAANPFNNADGLYYARIMRVTLPTGVTASGVIEIGISLFGLGTSLVTDATVPSTSNAGLVPN